MTAITMKSFVTRGKDHTNVAEREAVFSIEGDELGAMTLFSFVSHASLSR